MKFLAALMLLSFSVSSFAISTEKLIKACKDVGVEKVLAQARAMNVVIDADQIKECGVDNRPLNIAAYVWFCGTSSDGVKISQMTQKPALRKCF